MVINDRPDPTNIEADLDRMFKECQTEADRLLKKYLEDIKTDPFVQHPSCVLDIEIEELLANFRR